MVMADAFNALDLNTKSALGINTTLDYAAFNVYPNPSSGIITIDYTLKSTTNVRIVVSDIYGNIIKVIKNQVMDAGSHSTKWNAETYESGTYFIKIISKNSTNTRKIILLK
jgi:flagellar hook assembly protein FlgD